MDDARETYLEILSELDACSSLSEVENDCRWLASYLTHEAVFYQLFGGRHARVRAGEGTRFDAGLGVLDRLPHNSAISAFADFEKNREIMFYNGYGMSISAIIGDLAAGTGPIPEVTCFDIVKRIGDIDPVRSQTRLTFVGFEHHQSGPSAALPHIKAVVNSLSFHRIWCRNRCQPLKSF